MEAYPLQWPQGQIQTELHKRERSRFNITPDRARVNLLDEIRRLVGFSYRRDMVVISTDVRLRQDGEPYASQRTPENPGVAVYFNYGKKNMVFACDRWDLIHDNIHAIGKSIEALRGIERWGASDMLERAFTGFVSIEHQETEGWEIALEMGNRASETDEQWLAEAERNFRILRKPAHPDHGGSSEEFNKLTIAIGNARTALS